MFSTISYLTYLPYFAVLMLQVLTTCLRERESCPTKHWYQHWLHIWWSLGYDSLGASPALSPGPFACPFPEAQKPVLYGCYKVTIRTQRECKIWQNSNKTEIENDNKRKRERDTERGSLLGYRSEDTKLAAVKKSPIPLKFKNRLFHQINLLPPVN